MRYNGQTFKGPNTVILVIPKETGNVVFKAQAVVDFSPFEKICKPPEPPMITKPGQTPTADVNDSDYLKAKADFNIKRFNWITKESLKGSQGVEFDKVKDEDPNTWGEIYKELEEAFFTNAEINRIINAVNRANGYDDDVFDEALKSFLATQVK